MLRADDTTNVKKGEDKKEKHIHNSKCIKNKNAEEDRGNEVKSFPIKSHRK